MRNDNRHSNSDPEQAFQLAKIREHKMILNSALTRKVSVVASDGLKSSKDHTNAVSVNNCRSR
jgi:hypothetical protein